MVGTVFRIFFMVVIIIFFHTFYKELIGIDSPLLNTYFTQQNKYLNKGSLEYVTFQSINNGETHDTICRSGLLIKRENARGTVLICHGFMCDKFDVRFFCPLLFPEWNVLIFDFRAHGEHIDDRQTCTFGKDEAQDVYAAVSYLHSRKDLELDKKPLIGYGFSMGAVAAIQAQAEYKDLFKLLILDCPYDHSANILKKCMENLKFSLFGYEFSLPGRSLLEKYAFHPFVQRIIKALLKTVAHLDATATKTFIFPVSPAESMKNITIPCFFIHCFNDEKVSVQAAKNLYHNAQGYKRLWLTAGRRHFDSFFYNPEKYVYKINKFVNTILDNTFVHKKQAKINQDMIIQRRV